MKERFYIALTLIASTLSIVAQDRSAIKVIGKASDTKIQLRWAPDSPAAWHYANTYGYTIEKIILMENGKVLDQPQRFTLSPTPITPATEKEWLKYFDDDDYIGVAAQAIYGESFELDPSNSDILNMINKARELENRFGFALFAADRSRRAAQLSGLYYEDEVIYVGQKYLYRIYANVPENLLKIDTGFVFIGMEDIRSLPKIRDVYLEMSDRQALLSWEAAELNDSYTGYWVERSDDGGKTFEKITQSPIVNTHPGDKPNTGLMFKLDSLPQNGYTYHYRIIGMDSFGDEGPPSDTISGKGLPVFQYAPTITDYQMLDNHQIEIFWKFPEEGLKLLKSFDLLRKNQQTGKNLEILTNIQKTQRGLIDPNPASSNYYIIRANDLHGRSTLSFPYLVQSEDSIPPIPPTGLQGTIDTAGIVLLRWKPNEEQDLRGYKLFRSNFHHASEFIQVPGPIIETPFYQDTIDLKNLSETIYYSVQALDNRFNPSDRSKILALKKPDLIAPEPPVFRSIKSDSLGILITWANSGAQDISLHLLYRKSEYENDWLLIDQVEKTTRSFYYDQLVTHNVNYAYTMIAVDDDQQESKPAAPAMIKYIDPSPYPGVTEVFYHITPEKRQITISWEYLISGVDQYFIYKSVNDQPIALFKSVKGDQSEVTDHYAVGDENARYLIMAQFDTGEHSAKAKTLEVKL